MTIASLPPEEQPDAAPAQLSPNLRRQEVSFVTKEPAGTIVVDTPNTYLYYVLGNGRAVRYGVRVGREGFTWTGVQKISKKTEWPDWYPPTEMIERQPYLPRFMAGGPGNPLGARAMYLGSTRLPHSRHQPALDHRQVRLLRLHRHAERRRLRPVRAYQGRHPRGGDAGWSAARNRDRFGSSGGRAAAADVSRTAAACAADGRAAAARAGHGAVSRITSKML